jgi:hypothetical protein
MMSTTRHSTQYVSKGFSCGKGMWQVGGFTHWMNRRNGLLDGRLWPIDSILPTYLHVKSNVLLSLLSLVLQLSSTYM